MSVTVLSAPPPIQPLSTATDQTLDELFFARRALSLLKTRLGRAGLLALLAPDIAAGDAWWRRAVAASGGRHVRAAATLFCADLSVRAFLGWWRARLADADVMLGAHPEHFVNGHEVLETVGGRVSLFDLQFHGSGGGEEERLLPGFVRESGALDAGRWPTRLSASGVLKDGTVVATACHQFGDVEGGMEACVGGWMPEAVGEEVARMQGRHLAVEWGNWLRMAREELRGEGSNEGKEGERE